MEQKMMNLGRAKKKLRYFQSEKSVPCQLKIKDVFSMKDLDNIFDDLDSAPGTPLLSPLPKSPELDAQNKGSQSSLTNSHLPFIGDISPLKGSDVLAAEADSQLDHLTNKDSPLEEIAPIKTSSPIELLAVEDVEEDAERPKTLPLLFGIEDEEPVVGDLRKTQMNQISESPKDIGHGNSDSLESPPAQFKFRKPTNQKVSITSLTPQKAPDASDPVCRTAASEPEEEFQMDGCRAGVSLSPVVLIQKHQSEPPPKEQPNKQVQEEAVKVGVKQSLFQKNFRNSLQPKASVFRKQEPLKQPARAPSPHDQDDDFMILEDDCPIRFTIPRKAASKEQPAPQALSAGSRSKEKATPKQTKDVKNLQDEPQKKRKSKHQNNRDAETTDAVALPAPEEREDEVNVEAGGGEPICLSPETNKDADLPVTGKKIPKGKSSKPEQQLGKDGKNVSGKIPAEKPTAKIKKPVKLPTSTNTAQDERVASVNKKPNKQKSAVKEAVPESIVLSSVKAKKQDKGKSAVKNKRLDKEQEQVAEVQNHTEPTPVEQPAVQSTSTVKKANKEPKLRAPKKPQKMKKTKESLKITELVPESVSSEEPATNKRKRKPPGDWWLTQHRENSTFEQQKEVQSSPEVKSKRKTPTKAPSSVDSLEHESARTHQEIPNGSVRVQEVKKTPASKSQSSLVSLRKNPKSAGGRRKQKAGAQCDMTPALTVEEEARDNETSGQLSPMACDQRSLTAGNTMVFDKVYSRDSQRGSAQKCPPRFPHALESVPLKRRRQPLRNWWEVKQSQEPVESSPSPRTSSPQTSRPQMGPPQSAFHQMQRLQKTVGRKQKKTKTYIINTPKSVKRSLATFDTVYDSGKPGTLAERERGARQKGRRNLLHSLEDQSCESIHNDYQQQASRTFDVCVSGVVSESSASWRKSYPFASSGSNITSNYDMAIKSGPSSLIELERYEEHDDTELPSSRIIPQSRFTPRVMSGCDLCGPPLKPIVLDNEDFDNLCVWFAHIWPNTSKDSKSISPDDFHWHCHAGRAMGHMVDLQNNTFSNGKLLLGSYMNKPAQMDLNAITVFNVASSCVRVEIDGVKETYNSGQTFMVPCGQAYSIHNMCQEPAVLWYHRMLQNHTAN